jgi:hypothetical protein
VEDVELPPADGPLALLALPDGQAVYAVVRGRRRERDGTWWYDVRIHVPSQAEERGRLTAVPAPVDLRVPASSCTPVKGQAYGAVPTERHGAAPVWRIERPVHTGGDDGPARVVHRGDCASCRGSARPATAAQARAVLRRPDAAPCAVCRPDRPLGSRR